MNIYPYPGRRHYDDFDANEFYQAESETELKLKIEKCISYICHLKEPLRIINDRRSLKVIIFLRRNSVNNPELAHALINNKYAIEVFSNILLCYKNELKGFMNSYGTSNNHYTESYERYYFNQLEFVNELLLVISNITNESKSFCYKFHDSFGSKAILDYLDDTNLIKQLVKFKQKNVKTLHIDEIGYRFTLRLIQTLHNISVIADYRRKDFESLRVTNIIHNLIKYIQSYDDARMLCYITLANVVNDNEIETLPDTKSALEDIIALIRTGAECIVSGKELVRIKIDVDVDEDNEVIEDVCQLPGGWHIVGLLVTLYRLAVNDKIKYDIYETHSIHIELQKIISNGNFTEKEYAAKLLWQLCFDKRIAKKLYDEELLYTEIKNVAESDSITKSNLKSYCQGILWSVNKVIQQESNEDDSISDADENTNHKEYLSQTIRSSIRPFLKSENRGHIMISYNKFSRDLCLKINKELEKIGYDVWIDVDDMSGSSLEAMAKAIENSRCVLMCVTEKYKLSPNCRAEAEYAFRLNVPIIPLIMQEDYMPDGWLGIILGSKIYVNFKKYDFDECMRRLQVELNAIDDINYDEKNDDHESEKDECEIIKPSLPLTNEKNTDNIVKNWTIEQVQSWLNTSKFHFEIVKMLRNFNGELLEKLHSILLKSPDFIFKCTNSPNSIDLYSVVCFLDELEKLFKSD